MVIGMQRGMFFSQRSTAFLFRSTMSSWLWGGLSIFRIQSSFGTTPTRTLRKIALTGDYRVARAAYEEAVKRRPGRIVTLRQKTRLLADSRREPQ